MSSVNSAITWRATFKDSDENATDPTAVYFRTRNPAGTEASYQYGVASEVTKDSTGVYDFTYAYEISGEWHVRAVGTGALAVTQETRFVVPSTAFDSP